MSCTVLVKSNTADRQHKHWPSTLHMNHVHHGAHSYRDGVCSCGLSANQRSPAFCTTLVAIPTSTTDGWERLAKGL